MATSTLLLIVIKITFPSPASVSYLLPFTPVNGYLTRCSWENFATTLEIYLLSLWCMPGNYSTFRFTHFH